MQKKLGKIEKVSFGFGGYQDAQFGISFSLSGGSWGVCDFWGTWAEWSHDCKWTVSDQHAQFADTCVRIRDLLKDAKKNDVSKLVGVPIEVDFDGNLLKSWRVLTEVL